MRADAKKNKSHLLTIAQEVVYEHGANASLRDIARRADVGLATLYRHFPTRDALLEALLRTSLDELTQKAVELETSESADDALAQWVGHAAAFVRSYKGVVDLLAGALQDSGSPLHASCINLREAGARLLCRSQSEGGARTDLDGADLFALIGALGWLAEQPTFAPRAEFFFELFIEAVLTRRRSNEARGARDVC